MVNKTNFPKSGTTNDVGGMISASSKKNTVSESKIDMLNDTCRGMQVRGRTSFSTKSTSIKNGWLIDLARYARLMDNYLFATIRG